MKENLIEKSLYSHKSARLEASKPRAFFLFEQCSDNVRIMPINYYLLSPVRYTLPHAYLESYACNPKNWVN